MTLAIFIYVLIGLGCAMRHDEAKKPGRERTIIFVFICAFWPMGLGAILAEKV